MDTSWNFFVVINESSERAWQIAGASDGVYIGGDLEWYQFWLSTGHWHDNDILDRLILSPMLGKIIVSTLGPFASFRIFSSHTHGKIGHSQAPKTSLLCREVRYIWEYSHVIDGINVQINKCLRSPLDRFRLGSSPLIRMPLFISVYIDLYANSKSTKVSGNRTGAGLLRTYDRLSPNICLFVHWCITKQ